MLPPTLLERLSRLPARISVPVRRLFDAGHLNVDMLSSILDAGELAGDSQHLLAFAVAYVCMRSQAVEIDDVIRMAKAQRRRIDLSWSAKRWHHEHNRLARAESLARLAEVNVRYDLSKYAPHLPPGFKGYLIRTSRRLGMEGLRQRHCVATYHELVQSGYCALCVVFVGRLRCTVQLQATGESDAPLRVLQIRTRLNRRPAQPVCDAVYAALGLKPPVESRPRPSLYMENLRRILPALRAQGIQQVKVYFDGSGDDGSIEEVQFVGVQVDAKAIRVEVYVQTRQFDVGRWVYSQTLSTTPLEDAVKELTYEYLEETDVNWVDNEGGFGELLIDVSVGTVALEINQRVEESELAFERTRDIMTGAILDGDDPDQ